MRHKGVFYRAGLFTENDGMTGRSSGFFVANTLLFLSSNPRGDSDKPKLIVPLEDGFRAPAKGQASFLYVNRHWVSPLVVFVVFKRST